MFIKKDETGGGKTSTYKRNLMKRGFGRISSTEIKNNIIEDLQQ
jgi:hypothetical protein